VIAVVLASIVVPTLLVVALLALYNTPASRRRRELDRLYKLESARKAWEAQITRETRYIDWIEVRRANGGGK
jgi:hypothetical protein